MKKRLLPAFLIAYAVAAVAIFAQSTTTPTTPAAAPGGQPRMGPGGPGGFGGPGGPGGRGPQELDTELNKIMHTIEDNMRALRNPIKDMSQNAASLKTVQEIRDAFAKAAKEKPDFLKAQPEEKKAKFMEDYDAQMKKALAAVDVLIAKLKAGKSDEIQAAYKDVADFEDPSHKEFQAPKQPRGGFRGGPGGPGGPGGFGGPGGPGQQGAQPAAAPATK